MSIHLKKHVNKQGRTLWYANQKTWQDGKEVVTHLKKERLAELGIPDTLTYEEAKERVKQLNAQDKIANRTAKKVRILERMANEREEAIAFVPKAVLEEFETKNTGS